jgi:hypothetical protein
MHRSVAGVSGFLDVAIQDTRGQSIPPAFLTVIVKNGSMRNSLAMRSVPSPSPSMSTFRSAVQMTLDQYSRWRAGAAPLGALAFTDASGKDFHITITLQAVGDPSGALK